MPMPKVYRYQHKVNGTGPYNGALSTHPDLEEMRRQHSDWQNAEKTPAAFDDFGVFWFKGKFADARFACPTLDALIAWFDGWHDTLETLGFEVVEIEASEIQMGGDPVCSAVI